MLNSLRILQVVQKPQRRGAEIFAYQLSQALRNQGHTVQIAYLYPHEHAGALPLHNDDCVLDGNENHPYEKLLSVHPALLRRLRQVIHTFRPDIVQVNGARTVKYGALAHGLQRHPAWRLIYRNIGNPQDWVQGWRQRLFYRNFVMLELDGVVGVSQATLQIVHDFYKLSTPMAQIPRGVDPAALIPNQTLEQVRHATQAPLDAPVLLFVGSLTPEKRLDRMVRLVSKLRPLLPAIQLWLVGDGPLRAALAEQAQTLGVEDAVRFLGVQSNVANYLQAANLFLLTSDTEGLPGVLLEAGLLGLPVVATQVGGVAECVRDGVTGILVERTDEEHLTRAVHQLLINPQRRDEMGQQAAQWIREKFTMDRIVTQYIDFYDRVRQPKPYSAVPKMVA